MKLISPISSGTPEGPDKATQMAFKNSLDGNLNDYQVLIREHLQNSNDAFKKRGKYERLKFKISRTKLDFSQADLDGLLNLYKDYQSYTTSATEKAAMQQAIENLEGLNGNYSDVWVTRIEDNSMGLDGVSTQDDKTGSGRILSEYITEKTNYGKGSMGSFGAGKVTGFVLLNKSFTVFYYNRHQANSGDYLIGKVKIPTYFKDNLLYQKNALIGDPITGPSGAEMSTWIKPHDTQTAYRSLEEDGLTTIIPQFEGPNAAETEWSKIISYSILHSFFKLFENNEIVAEIEDEYLGNNLTIDSSNYKQVYQDIGTADFINNPDRIKNKYDYLISNPFVVGGVPKHEFDIELKVTKSFTGVAKLTLFENHDLNAFFQSKQKEIIDSDGKALSSVRFLRDGMLLRESRYPARVLPICELSGYIEFDSNLNEIVRAGENLRHDDFNYRNFDEEGGVLPAKKQVHQKFYNPINKFVRESIESIVKANATEGEEFEVDLDFNGIANSNNKPSFKRTSALTSMELPVVALKKAFKGKSGIPSDEYESGNIDEAVIIEIPDFIQRERKPIPPPPPPPPPIDENLEGTTVIGTPGKSKTGKKPKVLPELIFMSRLEKISSSKKEIKNYLIRIDQWPNTTSDLIISQLGLSGSSTVTFTLLNLSINGKRHRNFSAVKNSKNGISHYLIQGISMSTVGTLILSLEVKESIHTETNFTLKLKRNIP